jgi:hypothetical protein
MSFTYTIDPQAGLLLVLAEGVVTQEERLETLISWMTDSRFRSDLDAICDFSKAESTPTMAELREIVAFLNDQAEFIGNPRIAVVVSKAITFVVAHEFAAIASQIPLEVRVFSDVEAAVSWLRPSI